MSTAAVESAIAARLAAHSLPKAWPNQDFDPTKAGNLPYLACAIVKASTTDQTVSGEAPISVGRLIATVVAMKGKGTVTANGHADTIAALFPKGWRVENEGVVIEITGPPHIREGMPDGAYWRVPVSIPFRSF